MISISKIQVLRVEANGEIGYFMLDGRPLAMSIAGIINPPDETADPIDPQVEVARMFRDIKIVKAAG